MGSYNGKTTFDTFSHEKAVLERATWVDPKLLYPPYTEKKRGIMNSINQSQIKSSSLDKIEKIK